MEDQVISLKSKGIKAHLLSPKPIERKTDLSKFQVVYMTPELFEAPKGRAKLEEIKDRICLVAIDECHCVTQWGSDFRKTFRKLVNIKTFLVGVPVVCLTATATDYCQQDVSMTLALENPLVVRAELNRPNLEFTVMQKGGSFVSDIKKYLTSIKSGTAIIYVLRRRDAEQYSNELRREGFVSKPYHAGMKAKTRYEIVQAFSEGKLRFIVATIAFGMGIDRADVRAVIHYGSPRNLESFYQESGRAGRDGFPASCVVFWNRRDFEFHRYWLNNGKKSNIEYLEHCKNLINQMENFLISTTCRRMEILRYFDISKAELPVHENCCDNCKKKLHSLVPLHKMYEEIDDKGLLDLSQDSRILLQLVQAYKGRCIQKSFLKLLMGEIPKTPNRNHPLNLFGRGKTKPEAWWTIVLKFTLQRKFIRNSIEVQHIPIDPVLNNNAGEDDAVQMIVRREDFLKLTKHGRKFLLRKTKTFRVPPSLEIFPLLKKTQFEYYIENGTVKSKLRIPGTGMEIEVEKKKTENCENLFKFVVPRDQRKTSRKLETEEIVNVGACCSTWKEPVEPEKCKEIESETVDEEDDENFEAMKTFYLSKRRPLLDDIDELLVFLETFDENKQVCMEQLKSQPLEARDETNNESTCELAPEPLELKLEADVIMSDMKRVDLIQNCSLNLALKRLNSEFDDEDDEIPTKVCRLSQETVL